MAAMRARRGRGASAYDDGPPSRRRSRRAPPPPAPSSTMPRLAAIKLNGGLSIQDAQVSGKSLMIALAGLVFFTGASIAGAAWLGSSLFDVREAFARAADGVAADAGFSIAAINVTGVSGERAQEVRAMIVPEGRHSLLALDPRDVKVRVESLDWVERAQVRRLWPSTLNVEVVRRQAFARWREDGEISVIDANGERLLAERAADHVNLPLVVGAGAGPAAHDLLIALEELPQTRARINALVRVGERRWDAELKSGAAVALPEFGAAQALAQLERLQVSHRLLDRPVALIDMRAPGLLAVRVRPQLAGGPLLLAGGA